MKGFKKLLPIGLVLALLLMLVPMPVLAGETTVTGDVGSSVIITVPAAVDMGTVTIKDDNTSTGETISAGGNVAWKVQVADLDLTDVAEDRVDIPGKMTKYSSSAYVNTVYLANALKITVADASEGIQTLVKAPTTIATGDANTEITAKALTFTQKVVVADVILTGEDVYRLIATFTISAQ